VLAAGDRPWQSISRAACLYRRAAQDFLQFNAMKNLWWVLAIGIAAGVLASGLILLVSRPPRGENIDLTPPPTAAPLVVHVTGAVADPGVYHLPAHSRVQDAVQAAGGFLPEADDQAINLAAFLQDGERLSIPAQAPTRPVAENQPVPPAANPTTAPDNPGSLGSSGSPININTATQAELESLPGIGPVIAGRIIAYRQDHGPFASIQAIQDVSGIGPVTFERIQNLITTGTP
jgi:competence protein ComEA